MRRNRLLLPFTLRLTMWLTVLCCVGMLSALLAGKGLPTQLISFMLPTSRTFEAYQLHLMDIDAGLIVKFRYTLIAGCCPTWSPDGAQIAFSDLAGQTFIFDLRTMETRQLAPSNMKGLVAAWSPDGRFITLSIEDNDSDFRQLYRIAPDGSYLTPLTRFDNAGYFDVAWSPDSRFIIFAAQRENFWELYRINADGSDFQQLTADNSLNAHPDVSPDGEQITFDSQRDGNPEIYVIDVNGSNLQRLTWTDGFEIAPSWSPDGTQILFGTMAHGHINLMNADGSNQRRLSDEVSPVPFPAWSPNGEQILYEVSGQNGIDVYVMQADGSNPRRIIHNAQANYLLPAWQPQP
jgi:Tol biopolymer transport system component